MTAATAPNIAEHPQPHHEGITWTKDQLNLGRAVHWWTYNCSSLDPAPFIHPKHNIPPESTSLGMRNTYHNYLEIFKFSRLIRIELNGLTTLALF